MSTRSNGRRKESLLAQLSGPKGSTSEALPASTTRKRKVQPALKGKVEAFLATAASDFSTKASSSSSKKRKLEDEEDEKPPKAKALEWRDSGPSVPSPKSSSRAKSKASPITPEKDAEKRLRRHREKAPKTFLEKLGRAQTQRMIVVGRTRSGNETLPSEDIDIVGSTGNIYKVTIGQVPSCTCPDHLKGNECKHKVYALHTVLKAPDHLQYQLAYLSSELREIFTKAPPIPTNVSSSTDVGGNRKPVEGECPICYFDFDEGHNELVWCKAACGNNMHKGCFDQWCASQRGAVVKCVYCRTPWEVDASDIKSLTGAGAVGADGYVNVRQQFGMSGARDYSTYHQPWVRRSYLGMDY